PQGVLRSSGLLRYAQDCAWIHSERLGFDRAWYAARGLWWLVRCAELRVLGETRMGETVTVATTVTGYRKVWARRETKVGRATGGRGGPASNTSPPPNPARLSPERSGPLVAMCWASASRVHPGRRYCVPPSTCTQRPSRPAGVRIRPHFGKPSVGAGRSTH